ncbi:MAG: hypothetical protein KC652_19760 [Cyanobacteria bacterium HKST-UBA01]|nr:hypothetical protein [Cyanobacteria bacterium HKST-UBA01]
MRISLLIALLVLGICSISVDAREIRGGISVEEQHHNLKLEQQEAKMSTEAGDDTVTKQGSVVKQPDWITGKVYTNDSLYMYSYWELLPFNKRFKWEIPTSKKTNITFSSGIVKYWKGYMPSRPGKVICEPMEKGQEKFRFYHRDKRGPHGYFERAGKNKEGFCQYRIWFEEEDGAKAEEKSGENSGEKDSDKDGDR